MGIPAWAVKGAKVVCIAGGDPNGPGFKLVGGYPVTGGVYTIRSVTDRGRGGKVLLRLAEFRPFIHNGNEWGGWDADRFRPLVTQQDDIEAHFFHLLDAREDA